MAALGLVAMLLMAFLPTIGRLAGTPEHGAHHLAALAATPSQHAGHGQGHAMHAGMQHHGMRHAPAPAAPLAPTEHPRSPHSGDCEYCPLLASLVGFAVPSLPPVPGGAATVPLPSPVAHCAGGVVVAGLGARGPPHHVS
jgi:hypothetical protein